MALPALVVSRAPSLLLFTTLEAGLAFFVYSQWQKPSLIQGPLPSAIPKGYIGRARFGRHDVQPIHVTETLGLRSHTH
ncbi:hypothetical protein C8T65DRAFT_709956 [Cerioporus squamosus]|nr:hypothetical protein C8T65DRAFT_709956 [Cerioporus squamosus]